MWHVLEKGAVPTGFWWRDLRERAHLKNVNIDGRILLKCILTTWNGEAGTGLIWLSIVTGGRFL
jgi:hypothetical protein